MIKKITRPNVWTLGLLAVIAFAFIAALVGHPVVAPEHLAGLGMLPLAAGEITLTEVKGMIEKQNETWGEFMRKNDELLKAKAEGKAVGDLQASLDKMNADFKKMNDELVEIAKKSSRVPQSGGDKKALTPEQQEFKTALGEWCRKGDKADIDLESLNRKAYVSGNNPSGGWLVMPEMDTEIVRVVGVVSALGRLATNKTIGSDTYVKLVKTSGITARRVGAGATGGESGTPNMSELRFTAHEAEAEPWVHNSTLEDSTQDIEADLTMESSIAFAELAGNEFINGTGVGQARGILAYDTVANDAYSWGKVGYIKTGADGAFAASNPGDKLISLQHALKQQYRSGAAWLMADATLAQVRQMKDGSGNFYLWQPDPLAGFGGRLLGSPVETDDYMSAIANDSFSVAYGNWAQAYVVVNRTGIQLIRDNITAKGKTKFNFRRRFGGGVQNFEAYKLLQFKA